VKGVRSGQLIKFSQRSRFKTWEGEISQGMSGSQIFSFSVDKDKQVITDLQEKGRYVKLSIERYKTFPWWGDTKYFVIGVRKRISI
jgi:hypothetical protein